MSGVKAESEQYGVKTAAHLLSQAQKKIEKKRKKEGRGKRSTGNKEKKS